MIDPAQHARVEAWPFTAARAVQSILHERLGFMERLQQIANLTQIVIISRNLPKESSI